MKYLTKNNLYIASGVALAVGLAYYCGYTTAPTKVQEVTKTVEHNNIVTVVHTIKQPNGVEETVTTTTDKSINNKTEKITAPVVAQLGKRFDIGAEYNFIESKQIYSVGLSKRISGGLWMGVMAKSNGTLGATIGLEF